MPARKLFELSKHFHPVQPRFTDAGEGVTYKELSPDALLQGYICCYWQLASTKPLPNTYSYTVVADGCIDFFFDLNDLNENYVMGFSSEHASFPLKKNFNYVGVRFFPGAFPSLYNIEASALTNQCQNISLVAPCACQTLRDLLTNELCVERIKPLFDGYFKKIVFSNNVSIDFRFVESLHNILKHQGSSNVGKAISASVSERHLRRLFDFYIGASPKAFNKIVRFQAFLGSNANRESLKKEKIYYDMGYYDQSHFIKDFKILYGTTPLKAFRC